MNRQFPCILKGSHIWLAFDKSNAAALDSGYGKNQLGINFESAVFYNITGEYLANTYGEVKSKKHAHFIVELGEGHGYELCGSVSPNDAGQFIFDGEHGRLYFTVDNVKFSGMKQITIPLPPECESVDEWPKVGSIVEWGHTGKGEVKSLSDGFAWIKLDNKDYTTVYVSSLRKPKTPEQELRDEQIQTMSQKIRNKIPKISWDEAESISADLYDFGYRKPQ